MNRIKSLLALLMLGIWLAGCAKAASPKATATPPQPTVTIDGNPVSATPTAFAVMDDLEPNATGEDYIKAAMKLDVQMGIKGESQGFRYLSPAGKLPLAIVARLTEIEKADFVRSYGTITGHEMEPFMTEELRQRWQKSNNIEEVRQWYKNQGLEDVFVGIQVKTVLFAPSLQIARANYVRTMRVTKGDSFALELKHWKIGDTRTETHIEWLRRDDDGIWRIWFLSDPVF